MTVEFVNLMQQNLLSTDFQVFNFKVWIYGKFLFIFFFYQICVIFQKNFPEIMKSFYLNKMYSWNYIPKAFTETYTLKKFWQYSSQ